VSLSSYKYSIKFIFPLFCFLFFFVSCEEDSQKNGNQGEEDKEVMSGFIVDYFYDLGNESVDAKFLHYRKAEGGYSNTVADTTKIDVTKDTINFRTYNEFRLKVPESEIELYNQYIHFDETSNGDCIAEGESCIDIDYRVGQGNHYVIDNLSTPTLEDDGSEDGIDNNWEGFSTSYEGCISPSNDGLDNNGIDGVDDLSEKGSPYACMDLDQSGEYEIFSHQFTSIEKIIWDIEGSRYKTYLDTTFIHYEDASDPNSDFTQSQWEYSSVDVVLGTDTPNYSYDSLIYMTNINDFISPDTGIFYLDTLEFIKNNFSYTSEDIEIFQEFTFNNMQILSDDSIIYRVPTDCNRNNEWDAAETMIYDYNSNGTMTDILNESELDNDYCGDDGAIELDGNKDDICYEFEDSGNGILDVAELYYDLNNNGQYNFASELGSEPFVDSNCNGVWDEAESEDIGNGLWDEDEYFIDGGSLNGSYDNGEFIGSKTIATPSNLLFDYSENPPLPVIEIDEFTDVQDINGNSYNVIEVITILDSVYQYIPKIDSVVTIFSNEVITHFAPDSLKDLDYVITKTKNAYPSGLGYDISEYSYNIFNTDNHIKELKNPSFFLPYGFYETPGAIADGFWFDVCRDTLEIFLYAPGGIISTDDGNNFSVDTLIVNRDIDCDGDGVPDNAGNGDYNIEIDYNVEHLDSVMTKTRKVLTNISGMCSGGAYQTKEACEAEGVCTDGISGSEQECADSSGGWSSFGYNWFEENTLCLGSLLHVGLESPVVSDPADCYRIPSEGGIGAAALDTMVMDCFKITKTLTMTYIGSGVEYGEKTTIWLARDLGIVKNYLDIRWSEPFWVEGEQWRPYSRWELLELRSTQDNNLGRFLGKRRVSYDDFKNLIEFDNEPFKRRRTAGLHRVKIDY